LVHEILRKFYINSSQICTSQLSAVTTLPWEVRKVIFSTVLFRHTSDYLCYLRRKGSV